MVGYAEFGNELTKKMEIRKPMKKTNLALCALSLVSAVAFADLPPPPGSTSNAKIEGTAAQILFDSLSEAVGTIPAEYALKSNCGEDVNYGKVHVTDLGSSKSITVVCQTYYCRGHKAVCNLQEKF
jgi:hypothetical protein